MGESIFEDEIDFGEPINSTYGKYANFFKLGKVKSPSKFNTFGDSAYKSGIGNHVYRPSETSASANKPALVHNKRGNFAFLDGSVKSCGPNEHPVEKTYLLRQ